MTSTSNLLPFKPTYLYIKQHSVTGKLYFGKTTQNVLKYKGSGTRWLNHIKVHGKEHVVTLWHELFTDKNELITFALKFSKEMNIVESTSWLNLVEENGLDGEIGMLNKKHSTETKTKISIANIGKLLSEETKNKISISGTGRKHSDEAKLKMRMRTVSDETKERMKVSNKHSDEWKAKMSIMRTGEGNYMFDKNHSEETKIKMSTSHKNKKHSEETKMKMRKPKRKDQASVHLDTIWITNDENSMRIKKTDLIPTGYRKGRIIHKVN